jgi:hypothetical protein
MYMVRPPLDAPAAPVPRLHPQHILCITHRALAQSHHRSRRCNNSTTRCTACCMCLWTEQARYNTGTWFVIIACGQPHGEWLNA